ncbi:hypothetical protein BKA61DRAFT_576012 [Leptodontidium sp. MPI-SDFR-AT-0119]|nr:hypothetical protein BKA61DRAFT_576012 [Leptodontidium sp. MPI-SDFR-AT-0119]
MNKILDKARAATSAAKRPTNVSVSRGQTGYPKKQKDLKNLGIRLDYNGEVEQDGTLCNKFQIQPNAGKVDSRQKLRSVVSPFGRKVVGCFQTMSEDENRG